jgi:Family of unknown function (DUF6159)
MRGRISRGWVLTKKSWSVIRSHPGLARYPLTGGGLALASFLVLGIPGTLLIVMDTTASVIGGIALWAVAAYLSALTVTYFNVALAAAADQAMRGEAADRSAAMALARSHAKNIATWALLSAAVPALLGALRNRGSAASRLAGSVGAEMWSLVTFLVVPVLAFEGVGPLAAIKRSAGLFRQRWGQQVTGNVIIGAVFGFVVLVGVIVTLGGLIVILEGQGAAAAIGGGLLIAAGVTVAVAAGVLSGATRGVFGVALYRYVDENRTLEPFTTADLNSAIGMRVE